MSKNCSIAKCIRTCRGLCDCCSQMLCLQHLNEHNALLVAQLGQFTDSINVLEDRHRTLNILKIIEKSFNQLEEWREDCHKMINEFVNKKHEELYEIINKRVERNRQELTQINLKITNLINIQEACRQDIDSLDSTINQLTQDMNNIENSCLIINTRPLSIDETFATIKITTDNEINLSTLSAVHKTVHPPRHSSGAIACNDQHLVMHAHPYVCLLDKDLNAVKQILWESSSMSDLCWSLTLDRFILLEKNSIFFLEENTMSINKVQTMNERIFSCCTCSDTVLFVCTNEWASSILEFTLLPVIKLTKEWQYPLTCTKDELIDGIAYDQGNLLLLIMNNKKKSLRIELRYTKTLGCLWSMPLDVKCVQKVAFRCCALTCHEWLILDYQNECLLQITKDGKMKETVKYNPSPYRAALLQQNRLFISCVDQVLLHSIY